MNKIVKLDNGGYLAGCGTAHSVYLVADWMNGKAPAPTDKQLEESQILYVDLEGNSWFFEGTVSAKLPGSTKEALGTGGDFARTALDMGADAIKAVQMAIKRDIMSGGKIYSVAIDKKPSTKKPRNIKLHPEDTKKLKELMSPELVKDSESDTAIS